MQSDTCSLTNIGRVRKQNEDNMGYAATPNGDVFVVCDGMGGHVGGKVASSIAVESLIEYFNTERKTDIYHALDESIRYANRKIYERAMQEPSLKGMGTTLVMAVIQEDKTYIAHVGDSRIYLLSDNCLYRVTSDHSMVQQMVDKGILTPKEAETHPKKNIISKALGLSEDIEPEIAPEPLLLKNGDVLLLCSDGLSDMVNDITIHSVLMKYPNVKQAGDELIRLALEAGGKDNITLHLIKVTNSNYKKSIFIDKSPVPVCAGNSYESTPAEYPNPGETGDGHSGKKKHGQKRWLYLVVLLVAGLLVVFAYNFFKKPQNKPTPEKSKSWELYGNKEKNTKDTLIKTFSDTNSLYKFLKDSAVYKNGEDSTVQLNITIAGDSGFVSVYAKLSSDEKLLLKEDKLLEKMKPFRQPVQKRDTVKK